MPTFPYKRIVIIGSTSSGNSTLAEQIAKRFNPSYIDLDALHWEPNWTEAPLEVFRERVRTATQTQAWTVAGNYHVVRDLIWPQAEAIIWLDYSSIAYYPLMESHMEALVVQGGIMEWQSREYLETFQTMVTRFIIPLAIQNLLAEKTRLSKNICPARKWTFENHPLHKSP